MSYRIIAAAAATLAGLAYAQGPDYSLLPVVPACNRTLVEELASIQFFKYVVSHCVPAASSPFLTVVGTADPGNEGCLTQFVTHVPMVNPIPAFGACRESLQKAVDGIISRTKNFTPDFTTEILVDIVKDEITVSSAFYSFISQGNDPLAAFQFDNDIALVYPACEGPTVRYVAQLNGFEQMITAVANSASNPVSVDSADCEYCYMLVFQMFGFELNKDSVLKGVCAADVRDPLCRNSTTVMRGKHMFENCAGFDVESTDPSCSSAQIASISAVTPHPYFAMMQCAFPDDFRSSSLACKYFDAYISDQLAAVANSKDCAICYRQFYDLINTEAAAAVCSFALGGDYWSPECIASQADAFIAYLGCAGAYLELPSRSAYSELIEGHL